MPPASTSDFYRYDPKLGDSLAPFTRTAEARPSLGRPEMPARFVVTVEGDQWISTMWGKRSVPWRAEPGTQCVILGYWADGTVRLSWPAIEGAYRVDGRFPAWVVEETPNARMAAGGHILKANNPPTRSPALFGRLTRAVSHLLGTHR
jgi:hypothetical protein